MKLSKFVKRAKSESYCVVIHADDSGIWLGTRLALYNATELPYMEGKEQAGAALIAPIADVVKTSDYIQTVVRKTAGGAPYVVIKDGFEVLAGFAPLKIITKQFLEDLSEFESACVSQYMREQKQALDAADPDKQDEGAEQIGMEGAESESE